MFVVVVVVTERSYYLKCAKTLSMARRLNHGEKKSLKKEKVKKVNKKFLSSNSWKQNRVCLLKICADNHLRPSSHSRRKTNRQTDRWTKRKKKTDRKKSPKRERENENETELTH